MTVEIAGIYVAVCLITQKRYVGSSRKIWRRIARHTADLTTGAHVNRYFQAAWDKHGAENFKWDILEECSGDIRLAEREQWWIDHYDSGNPKKGYNIQYPVKKRVPAEQMSAIVRGYWASLSEEELEERHAYKRTESHRQLMSEKANGQWADPTFRELMTTQVSATMKELCSAPEQVDELTKRSRGYWEKKSSRQKVGRRMMRQWADLPPEERERRKVGLCARETTKYLEVKGVRMPLKEWAEICGLRYGLLLVRFNRGASVEGIFAPSYKYKVKDEFAKWLAGGE